MLVEVGTKVTEKEERLETTCYRVEGQIMLKKKYTASFDLALESSPRLTVTCTKGFS